MTEKDNSHQHDESLVQQHALKRLDKVEEEKQKPYKKKKEPINFRSVFMTLLLILVVGGLTRSRTGSWTRKRWPQRQTEPQTWFLSWRQTMRSGHSSLLRKFPEQSKRAAAALWFFIRTRCRRWATFLWTFRKWGLICCPCPPTSLEAPGVWVPSIAGPA